MSGTYLALNFAACSDRGLVRGNNEDSAYAGPRLLALADGMGGHAAGEVASQFLIDAFRPLDSPLLDDPQQTDRPVTLLAAAADQGNRDIAAHVDENPQLEGMGCTLTALLFRGSEAAVCHVGDSRAYRVRGGTLKQVTKDDTFVQSLVDEGRLDAADVSSHPQRSLILKALTGRPVTPTLTTVRIKAGDRFMLCSDGLSDPVSFSTIEEVLAEGTPEHVSRRLVEMALRSGGPDNVTVIVADVVATDERGIPLDKNVQLPAAAVLAGAVAPDAAEFPRPNSAASRAAALGSSLRHTQDPRPVSPIVGQEEDEGEDEQGVSEPSQGEDATSTPSASAAGPAMASPSRPEGAPQRGSGRVDPDATTDGFDVVQAPGHDSGTGSDERATGANAAAATAGRVAGTAEAAGAAGGSATGRARKSRPAGPGRNSATGEPPADEDLEGGSTGRSKRKSRGRLLLGGFALLVILALIIGGFLGYQRYQSSYFLARNSEQIAIRKGFDTSVLGLALNRPDHEVCLDKNAKLQLIDPQSSDNCHRFSTTDLKPSARSLLESMPEASFEDVVGQLHRLAAQTLPVCVTREPAADKPGSTPGGGQPANPSAAPSTPGAPAPENNAPSAAAEPADAKTPEASAPEDLTTPGVSCREVSNR
ncbi:PP2C-family Ser/Thr phosphatase [Corynebacterium heidelbergense]|uniref:Serine/threonine-protein phosphatase n=1 Tax=Corynebacterium heidelbergense TaxID=2055947 RepID=A0A364VB98_9CORY|nr:protein phosphatase 2C domain-containing protein [Corynebacterium heidelbergense]RAV33930.1 serine/threonine-protein phosphatase [Corynebacterium heidelbergense]WCZ35618.1 PP2C-family Ser/Thr phosphatase [Corynebacterium heidelbergense]